MSQPICGLDCGLAAQSYAVASVADRNSVISENKLPSTLEMTGFEFGTNSYDKSEGISSTYCDKRPYDLEILNACRFSLSTAMSFVAAKYGDSGI